MTDREGDVAAVLGRRHDNGADHWATPDGRIYVGNPFSTIGSLNLLHELGLDPSHEAVAGGLDLIVAAARPDGRIRVAPTAPLYPCYTAEAARMLCRFGLGDHDVVAPVVERFLASPHESGGWRCPFTKFGRGPETEYGSPGATLYVLDVLRFFRSLDDHPAVRSGVSSLLDHWESRAPIGPCHHGIGSRFLTVEYPFVRYNVFFWVYVLSHFPSARDDTRFAGALDHLRAGLDDAGRVVVGRPHRGLGGLAFCAKGRPSDVATRRFAEIEANLGA